MAADSNKAASDSTVVFDEIHKITLRIEELEKHTNAALKGLALRMNEFEELTKVALMGLTTTSRMLPATMKVKVVLAASLWQNPHGGFAHLFRRAVDGFLFFFHTTVLAVQNIMKQGRLCFHGAVLVAYFLTFQ